jgi:hypothetical protein
MTLHHRRPFQRTRPQPLLETLEHRQLLNTGLDPVGAELKVGGPVERSAFELQSVDTDRAGNFVVAWSGYDTPDVLGSRFGVQARRYAADGTPLGAPFVVNTTTERDQWEPSVAVDADGDFVLAWTSNVNLTDSHADIYARLFDKSGNPKGPEFLVNQTTAQSQGAPQAGIDDAGNFVIAWRDQADADLEGLPVKFRRYDASGAPLGDETVAARMTGFARFSLAMEGDGDFIVAWNRIGLTGVPGASMTPDVFVRRFDASGAPAGGEIAVASQPDVYETDPQVAVNDSGQFAVA